MSIWAEQGDCFVATTTAAILTALGAAGAGAATAYGMHEAANANKEATAASTTSNAAAIAEQQRQDAERKAEFDQQQAAAKAQWDAEQQIRAPYRQAGAAALSSLGGILGVNFGNGGGGSPAAAPAASGPMPAGIDWTAAPDVLGKQLVDYYTKAGVSTHEVPYWVSQAPSLVARGQQLGDPNYANKRLAASEVFGGGSPGSTPISAVLPRPLAPATLSMAGIPNALAPSYGAVVPMTALMGGR